MPPLPSWCICCSRPSIQSSRAFLRRRRTHPGRVSRIPFENSSASTTRSSRLLATRADGKNEDVLSVSNAARSRAAEVKTGFSTPYPRVAGRDNSLSCEEFRSQYARLKPNETLETDSVVLRGRIRSIRAAGNKLLFLDFVQNGRNVQILCNFSVLSEAGLAADDFAQFSHLVRRGDNYMVTGNPHRTSRGELSLRATSLPTILSPCLHDFPESHPTQDRDFLERHVELLSTPHAADTLRCRSAIIQYVRDFLLKRSYLEVQTPILAAEAGGATARPFDTTATEFQGRKLSLRIAPELWLKRLILGGLDRVFEIGPSFRNEGLDKNHNPEFTTCEFYEAFASLDDLILMTEDLLSGLLQHIQLLKKTSLPSITPPSTPFTAPFPRLEFIPTIERLLETQLPDLTTPSATDGLITLFHSTNLPLPPGPTPTLTLPRLLDKLSTHLLEPLCIAPTFITHHPSILSPLSKSFVCPTTHQLISARAELYVQNQELANMYEEENSPFEQREKFLVQLGYREDGETDRLDEGYLRALEWGLPPTGGWGCGIDRLVMVMAGAKRIGSVLSFGNLRAVTRGVD